eukprot:2177756-Prymnesium_polylepis.1
MRAAAQGSRHRVALGSVWVARGGSGRLGMARDGSGGLGTVRIALDGSEWLARAPGRARAHASASAAVVTRQAARGPGIHTLSSRNGSCWRNAVRVRSH